MDIYTILFILFGFFLAVLSGMSYLMSKEILELYTHILSLTKRISELEKDK